MRIQGEVRFEYEDNESAQIVSELLEIDNRIAPRGMRVSTRCDGRGVITTLRYNKLNTFFATLDDLAFSEKIIEGILNRFK